MAIKQPITKQQARILIYLDNCKIPQQKNASQISARLDIDYGYTIRLLQRMKIKNWVRTEKYTTKTYYFLNNQEIIKQAMEAIK